MTTPATCTAQGEETRVCQNNPDHKETKPIAIDTKAHKLTKTPAKAPTVTEDGNNDYWTCEYCQKVFSDEAGTTETTVEAQTLPKLVITGFDPVANQSSTTKPALADAVAMFPTTVGATLSDTTTTTVTVSWGCANYDSGSDGDYTFTAALAAGSPAVKDGVALPTATLHVGPATSGDYTYRLDAAGNATIVSWNGSDKDLFVPAQLDGHSVIAIGAGAFQKKASLTSLEIPAGVKTIGENAFADCENLATLVLPDTLDDKQVPATIIANDKKALTSLKLSCTKTTKLTSTTTYTRTWKEGDQTKTATITLPMAVTDVAVTANVANTDVGNLTIACDFTVDEGHAIIVDGKATLVNSGKMINYGSIANSGSTINNTGTLLSCTGTVTGTIGGKGTYKGPGEHSYSNRKCTVCGAQLPKLSVSYTGGAISKVFDHTRNVKLSVSDFKIDDKHGLDVNLKGISAAYNSPDAGKRTVNVTLTIKGKDVPAFTSSYKKDDKGIPYYTLSTTVNATIEPKPLIITPTADQKKVYGAADPKKYTGTVKGLYKGDKITGKLSRETGENVGSYRIVQGTIDAGTNYDVQVKEEYFTIEAKSINSSDVGLVTIGNQRYNKDKPAEPEITLRFGKNTLKKDVDFKVTYKDNDKPGTATVELEGIGNYTGKRTTQFRILNIASGVDTSTSGSGGGGSYSYDGFDDKEESADDFDEEGEKSNSDDGSLVLDEVDYGTILFLGDEEPAPFVQFSEKLVDENGEPFEPEQWRLTIIADPLEDEETGDALLLENSDRERYGEIHLRLTSAMMDTLASLNYTEIVLEVENAQVCIPLSKLAREFELDNSAVEVVGSRSGDDTDDEADLDEEANEETNGDVDEAVDELDLELASTSVLVECYDISVTQVETLTLTEREQDVLDQYEPLTPAYRVRVRAVLEGDEEVELGADDAAQQTKAGKLSAADYPKDLTLRLLPLDDFDEEPENAEAVYISSVEDADDPDVIDVNPAQFVNVDEMYYCVVTPTGDGLYFAGRLGGESEEGDEDVEDDEDDEDDQDDEDEEDYEDLDDAGDLDSPSGLSTMGATFTVDENGQVVTE